MYNVLDIENNKIQVKEINTQLHRHVSGREFTEDDACVKATIVKSRDTDLEACLPQGLVDTRETTIVETVDGPMEITKNDIQVVKDMKIGETKYNYNMNGAREAYKAKYNKYPSKLMKLENIIAKI